MQDAMMIIKDVILACHGYFAMVIDNVPKFLAYWCFFVGLYSLYRFVFAPLFRGD